MYLNFVKQKRIDLAVLTIKTSLAVTLGMIGYAGVMGDFNANTVESILIA